MDNLTEKERIELEKLRKQKEKKLKRQNAYAAENYDRIAFVLPKGSRDKIREHYKPLGLDSLADIFKHLLKQDGFILDSSDDSSASDQENFPSFSGFSDVDQSDSLPFG